MKTNETTPNAATSTPAVDTIRNPNLLLAVTTDEQRAAVAVACAYDALAEDAARMLRRADEIAGEIDAAGEDATNAAERVAVARAYASALRWAVPTARDLAERAAVAALVDLARTTDPTTDAGALVRRVAAARYGVRIGVAPVVAEVDGVRVQQVGAATSGDDDTSTPADDLLPCYHCRLDRPPDQYAVDRRTRRGRARVCNECRRDGH
jgi:hypothetical protein